MDFGASLWRIMRYASKLLLSGTPSSKVIEPYMAFPMNRACAALGDAASVLGADQVQMIAQHPQYGGIGVHVHVNVFAVYGKRESSHEQ